MWQQHGFSYLYLNGVQTSVVSTFSVNRECKQPLWIGHTAYDEFFPSQPTSELFAKVAETNSSNDTSSNDTKWSSSEESVDSGSGIEGSIALVRVYSRVSESCLTT